MMDRMRNTLTVAALLFAAGAFFHSYQGNISNAQQTTTQSHQEDNDARFMSIMSEMAKDKDYLSKHPEAQQFVQAYSTADRQNRFTKHVEERLSKAHLTGKNYLKDNGILSREPTKDMHVVSSHAVSIENSQLLLIRIWNDGFAEYLTKTGWIPFIYQMSGDMRILPSP